MSPNACVSSKLILLIGMVIAGAKAADMPASLPLPTYAGGAKAITLTPVVGTPRHVYPERYIPGEESLGDGELRVTVLGSGNPWTTRAQASGSILVEVGNPQRDILVFDLGSGSLASDQLPPIPGVQTETFTPVPVPPPTWWEKELIPLG